MKMRIDKTTLALVGAVAIAAALLVAGCGSSSTTVTERQTTTVFLPGTGGAPATDTGGTDPAGTGGGTAGGGKSLQIQMGDFFFKPVDATAGAGSVKLSAVNVGATTHELVLARTDLDPAKLPTLANGEVDEDKLDGPGEIPDVAVGTTGKTTVDLQPGRYAVYCNLPGHYAQGMFSSLTVSAG